MTTIPKTVLIVDSNHDAADTLAILVRLHGHIPLVAYDRASGEAMAERTKPEVIFHDVDTPIIDGYEAARRYRKDGKFERTLLVAVTAYKRTPGRDLGTRAGYDLYMSKPIELAQLKEILSEQNC